MERRRVVVKQVKEWGEILTGIECRNRYELFDENSQPLGFAAEESGGAGRFFGRLFLGQMRPATIHVTDTDGVEAYRGVKPFRWFFHRMDCYEGDRRLGAIERKWSWLHRTFVIENANGDAVLEIFSPLFRIWTFKLQFQGKEIGVITKKWGGALREMFSDADTFGIEHDALEALDALRPILVCATFLIDFTCFENNNGGGGLSFLGGE